MEQKPKVDISELKTENIDSLVNSDRDISQFLATRKNLVAEIRNRYRYTVKTTYPIDENLMLLEMCKYELLQEQVLLSSPLATNEMTQRLPQIIADLQEINLLITARKSILTHIKQTSSILNKLKRWLIVPDNSKTSSNITYIKIKSVGNIFRNKQK